MPIYVAGAVSVDKLRVWSTRKWLCNQISCTVVEGFQNIHVHIWKVSPSLLSFFLLSLPSIQIVLEQQSEVLALDCEMGAVHGHFSKILDKLDYEQIIAKACQLIEIHPPEKLAEDGGLKLSDRSVPRLAGLTGL